MFNIFMWLLIWLPHNNNRTADKLVFKCYSPVQLHYSCLSEHCHVMVMWWPCDGHVMAVWWSRDGSVMVTWWQCDGHVMAVWWSCDGRVMVTWWQCDGHVMVMWWLCDGHVMVMWLLQSLLVYRWCAEAIYSHDGHLSSVYWKPLSRTWGMLSEVLSGTWLPRVEFSACKNEKKPDCLCVCTQ